MHITARNPNQAFPATVRLLDQAGVLLPSRNGDCLEYPEPVTVTFTHPQERVLTHPARRINPFLHFFEPLWMLSGRHEISFLCSIVERFREFSDDGLTFAAAYGHRMRNPDQIEEAVKRLRANPDDRRTVLMIRFPMDIYYNGKDAACNLLAALKVRDGALNMHVFNRSNDAIWGGPAGGTNHPQFTTLLEYLAGRIGCEVGKYTVTTDSMHAYTNDQWKAIVTGVGKMGDSSDPYVYGGERHRPFPFFDERADFTAFDEDLETFFWHARRDFKTRFFKGVFLPMLETMESYKARDGREFKNAARIEASDWQNGVLDFFDGISRLQRERG